MSIIELLNAANTSQQQNRNAIYGVVVGIVQDIKDPENLGRVKVDFPWLAEEADAVAIESGEDRAHSFWARIATLMAGKERGSFFVPEVGDEVLVAFEHGNVDRPYVLGGLWNSDDKPHETMDGDGKNNLRSIKTRSGHVVTFDDNSDENKAKITIHSQGGHEVVLDDDGGQGKIEMKTNGGHTLTLDDAGSKVTLSDSAGNQVVLDANSGAVSVESSGDQDYTVGGALSINVTGSATISAPSGVTIDSTSIKLGNSASMTLVNDTLLTLYNTHFHVGNLGAPTSPPTVPAIKNVQSTIFTKGA